MEEAGDESMKHMCRFCNKGFPCGRSLGGHMRSHVINSTDHHDQVKKKSCLGVVDKVCKECGKGFQSWKALFGHMKCHSDKVSNSKTRICDQDSWIRQPGKENSGLEIGPMKKSRSRNGVTKRSMVTTTTTTTTTTTHTASSSVSMNGNHTSTSVVSDIYDEQDADMAMCLIMLSKDVGKSDTKMMKIDDNQDEIDNYNKRKFECATCNKSYHSYQALGGHKASHKKLKGRIDLESIDKEAIKSEPMLDHDHITNEKSSDDHKLAPGFNLDGSLKKAKMVGAYECSICLKVFLSGQALGGHKRSHLIAEARLNQQNLNSIEKFDKPVNEIRGLLDLNMPPDDHVEEEEQQETIMMNTSSIGTGYNPCCYNHESTLGLISTS